MDTSHFEWKDEYSVKVAEIDEQHQKLIKIIDDLYQALMAGTAKASLPEIFGRLNDYVIYHFATEEKYFKEFEYKDAPMHISQHEKYKIDIAKMEKDADNGALDVYELLFYLENWWINHILDSDKKYSEFFNEHGLH
jgi:hemerythrin-like metal-binding protein